MKTLKINIIVILVLLFAGISYSQQNYLTSFEYSTVFNTGKTSDFISVPGWVGLSINYTQMLNRNVGAGITVAWNVDATEEDNVLQEFPNGAVYGRQARYFNYFPVLGNVSYFFHNKANKVVPYVRLNTGAYYIAQRLTLGVYELYNENWHFGVAPELGMNFNLDNGLALTLNGKFNYAFDSGDRMNGDTNNDHMFINVNFGVAYLK